MNLFKIKIISVISIFLLSFFTHYGYDIFPNLITSFLFPVNESIFEHMKMIFTSYIIYSFFEYILIKKYSKTNNFSSSILFNILFNIIFFLIIYIPIYNITGYNHFITLFTYFISIVITQIFSYIILNSSKNFNVLNKYSYLFIFIIFLILIYLTYYPPKISLFIDKSNNKIGINSYYV